MCTCIFSRSRGRGTWNLRRLNSSPNPTCIRIYMCVNIHMYVYIYMYIMYISKEQRLRNSEFVAHELKSQFYGNPYVYI